MSKKSIEKEAEEQRKQDEKWKDYKLPEGFIPNRTYLIVFQILYALLPLVSAVGLIALTVLPLCAGQSVTSFIADIVSCSSFYRIRGIFSLFIVLGVVCVFAEAADRVVGSVFLDFTGVKKRSIRGAIFYFVMAGILPVALYYIGKKYLQIGNFKAEWAFPMAAFSLLNLISAIIESVVKKDKKTEKGEEPSFLHKCYLSVYGDIVNSNKKILGIIRELSMAVIIIACLAVQFALPFMNEEEYLTEERVAEVEELENPTLGDICDILGTPAYMVAEEGDPLKGYVFYGIEMNRTFFNEKVDLSLATVHQYAVEKGKVIPALMVFTDKENKVITIIYYENVAEDKDLDIDFDFGF